jgi:hypothetical protein
MMGTTLDGGSGTEFEDFFKEQGFRVKFAEEVITLPDLDSNGNKIPETGGRTDLLFYIHAEEIGKFSIARLQFGIRWWEDVVSYNDNSHLYSQEILDKYKITW